MVARIQRFAGLVVRFFRDGEEVDARVGSTGEKHSRLGCSFSPSSTSYKPATG